MIPTQIWRMCVKHHSLERALELAQEETTAHLAPGQRIISYNVTYEHVTEGLFMSVWVVYAHVVIEIHPVTRR